MNYEKNSVPHCRKSFLTCWIPAIPSTGNMSENNGVVLDSLALLKSRKTLLPCDLPGDAVRTV